MKILITLTLLFSFYSLFAVEHNDEHDKFETIERLMDLRKTGDITDKGFILLLQKHLTVERGVIDSTVKNEELTLENLAHRFDLLLERGEITDLGHSRLMSKLQVLKKIKELSK